MSAETSVSTLGRPRWIAVTAIVVGVALLVGLGTWQLFRRAEKHALIAHIKARIHGPAVMLPARIGDAEAWDYRHVRAAGHFLNDREIHLASRVRDGIVGVDVVTPLKRTDGATVLVNRGWVPQERADPATRAAGQLTGTVTVTGVARVPYKSGLFTPDNEPAKGFWMIPNVAQIVAEEKLGPTLPIVLEADATPSPGGLPEGRETRVDLPDNHLQYAFTWYALAIVLIVIARRARRRRKSKTNATS